MVQDERASGILLGTFATGAAFPSGCCGASAGACRWCPDWALLRRMFRFGLPTMPAELSLYSLNFIDRIILVRLAGLAEAGLYALAVKFAQGINVLARGIQLAWPPLAYSIQDDEEARRAYSVIFTWFAVVLAFGVTGLWLESRWIVRLLAAPEFFGSHRAVGLLATGIALYALYLAMVIILGRTGRTEFSFPATIAATATNVVLNLVLVPPLGIVGAGLALVASYLVVVVADVRVHAAAVSGSVRVAAPGAGRALGGGAGRRRRGAPAHLGVRRPREPHRAVARLPGGPVRDRVPPRGGALPPGGDCSGPRRSRPALAACAPPARRRRGGRRPGEGARLGPEVYEAAARDEDRGRRPDRLTSSGRAPTLPRCTPRPPRASPRPGWDEAPGGRGASTSRIGVRA